MIGKFIGAFPVCHSGLASGIMTWLPFFFFYFTVDHGLRYYGLIIKIAVGPKLRFI